MKQLPPPANGFRHFHAVMTIVWAINIPVAILTGWIYSLAYISVCSIYANMVGHFGSWQASRAEEEANDD